MSIKSYDIRKARVDDAEQIQKIINFYAKKGKVIPKSLSEIYEGIRDYFVHQRGRRILGVCCLKIYWKDLAEVCSLAVRQKYDSKGVGTALLEFALKEAKNIGVASVFALTYNPEFFVKRGFRLIEKEELPQKIWKDCIKCVRFPKCDEIAVIIDVGVKEDLKLSGEKK